ncbi:MAG: glyoxylate reductase [Dehalococcoidia bacterium SM23_28_2]|nr:MAG: glyoxylate reductase [Dehalococcoidia bacterium SM23_28_2]
MAETEAAKVYITRELPSAALDPLREMATVRVWPGELPPPPDVLLAEAADADALLTLLTDRIDARIMAAAPRLRAISNMAVGYDNIDVQEASRRAILVTNTPGILTKTTADFAFALLLAAARRVVEADRYTREGRWKTWGPQILLGQDIHDATLGVMGLGGVGLEVAKRGRGFGMRVLYYDKTRKPKEERRYRLAYAEPKELLAESDFISLHVPLTAETHHLIGERELSLMKPTAVLVNTARGTIVDQRALWRFLKERRIAAAAIDVSEQEPIAPDDPLLGLDNIIITPHIASASVATRLAMAKMAVDNLLAAMRGEVPPHCVNREAVRRWRQSLPR